MTTGRETPTTKWKHFFQDRYPAHWRKRIKGYGFTPYHQAILDKLSPQPGERILECGVGTGEPFGLAVAKSGAEFYGVDIATTLLQDCTENLKVQSIQAHLATADIEALPFSDNSFDKTYCVFSTWYLPDLAAALREMCRVTRPGGLLLFDIINGWHVTSLMEASLRLLLGYGLRRPMPPQRLRGHGGVRRTLNRLPLRAWDVAGYYLFLPSHIPLLRVNPCSWIPPLAYGLADSPARFFGSKLIYTAHKNDD